MHCVCADLLARSTNMASRKNSRPQTREGPQNAKGRYDGMLDLAGFVIVSSKIIHPYWRLFLLASSSLLANGSAFSATS